MAELLFFLEALGISYFLTGAILRFSLKRRLLDIPNDRSSHSIPKPRLGGVAITLAFYLACATMLLAGYRPFASATILAGTLGAGAVIALSGLLDDLRGLDARLKLLVQIAAAGIAVACGVVMREFSVPLVGSFDLGALAVPATIVWIVAMINFYNFIDGIDGLAAGVGMIASAFLYFLSGMTGAAGMRSLYAVLAGSSFGFLRFNFPPARIFMGDMGSTFIGYVFAVLAVIGAERGVPAFMTVLLLASSLGDAALTLVRRAFKRERLFSPHRTHYYQRLTSLGLSHKQVTLLEYLIAMLLGVSAILAFQQEWSFVTFLSVIWIGFFLWALAKIRSMERGNRLLWEGRTLGVAFGDLAFIAASYMLSYYLRLNFRFPPAETSSMLMSLPIVLVIRTAVFYYYGLYRGLWRYTTFDDIIRIAKAVSVGTVIMVVSFAFLFRFRSFPRSAFIIDWFVLIVFMAGSRVATRWFHELPSREEISAKRVIIAGTGAVGELILRQVKKSGGMRAIGYLDDRTEMTGRVIGGLRVLGPISEAEEIAKSCEADEIIAAKSLFDRIPEPARARLAEAGVGLRFVSDAPDIVSPAGESDAESPCEGLDVLVAGNGTLVGRAREIFARASTLTVLSAERGVLEETARRVPAGDPGVARYLVAPDDGAALGRIFESHVPAVVCADFTAGGAHLANALEADVTTVMLPLERLAAEVSRRSGSRLFVFERIEGFASEDVPRALELVLLDRFRLDPARLTVVRVTGEPGVHGWRGLIGDLVAGEGGVHRAVPGGAGERPELLRTAIEGPVPEAASRYRELLRRLDGGDRAAAALILAEMARSSPVSEHVS